MDINTTNKQIIERQEIFPWHKKFLDKVVRNFLDDCNEDLLYHLIEDIKNEVKASSGSHDRKRLKTLFETVQNLFLHFWWRIQWKGKQMWKNYWRKDYTNVFTYDLRTKCVVKLLYFIIYIGIQLSEGATDSSWINRSLQAMKVLPDCDNIIFSSLLLVKNINKKYLRSYCEILKNVLISKATKCISEPVVYIKIMILFRRLRKYLKVENQNKKKELLSAALKFQAPSNLIPWMVSLDLDVSKIEHKNIVQCLFEKTFKDLFQKLQTIVNDYEFLHAEKHSNESINNDENQETLLNLDSAFNIFHSPGNLEALEKESIKIPSDKKKSEFKKKREKKSEKKRLGSTEILEKTDLESFNNGDNETTNLKFKNKDENQESLLNLDSTFNLLHSPEDLEKESIKIPSDKKKCELKKKKSKSKKKKSGSIEILKKPRFESFNNEDNETTNLNFKNKDANQELLLNLDSTFNLLHSPEDLEKESIKIPSDKKKNELKKKKSKSKTKKSGNIEILKKSRFESFNNEDNETTNLKFKNKDANQESLLNLDSTFNLLHSPEDLEKESIKIPSDKKKSELKKKKSKSKKKKSGSIEILKKSRFESFNNKDNEIANLSFTPDEIMAVSKTSANSNETDSVSLNGKKYYNCDDFDSTSFSLMNVNRTTLALGETCPLSFNKGDDNDVNLGITQSSPTCINNTVLKDDMNSRNKSVNLSLQPSSPKQRTLFFKPKSQLNASDHQIPLLLKKKEKTVILKTAVDKTNKRKKLSKKLSLGKNGKTSLKTGCKKFKLFNPDLFDTYKKSIEAQSKKNVLCNVNESSESVPLNISSNKNSAHNVNMLQNSFKEKPILLGDQLVFNRYSLSDVGKKSSSEITEDVATEQVYSHGDDSEIYIQIFDSMPDSSVDNSLHANTNNASQVNLDVSHPNNMSSLRTFCKENVINNAYENSTSKANIVYDKTVDHVANQIPIHLQHTNIINPNCQLHIGDNNLNLSWNDSETRHEHLNSINRSEVIEQLSNDFNSFRNLNSNSNSDSFSLNESHQNDPRICSRNENIEYFGNQNLNQTGNPKNIVEGCSNRPLFPLSKSISSTCDRNTSFPIDCNFVIPNQPPTEISSIKVIINLTNKKQDDSMYQSNEHHASNFEVTPPVANSSINTFIDGFNLPQRNILPIASLSQVMPQCNGDCCSHPQINNSHKETSTHSQVGECLNFTTSTPYKENKKTSTQSPFNEFHNKANFVFSSLHHAHTTSQWCTSTEGSEFYTPNTLDCDNEGSMKEPSPPTVSSLQKRYIERCVSNPMKVNLTPAFTSLQQSSPSGSRQHQPVKNATSTQTSPLSKYRCRKSARDIYSDVSSDNGLVSSLGIISDEDCAHSLMRSSNSHSTSESPLKTKCIGSNNHCRKRTISNSSIEHHPTPENNYYKTKKLSFTNLNSAETNTETLNSEHGTSNKSNQTIGNVVKRTIQTRYNLRSRKQMKTPNE